jgi:hypothetical protein
MTLVRYHSQEHGNTQAMAEAVAEGGRAPGAVLSACRELGEKLAGAA